MSGDPNAGGQHFQDALAMFPSGTYNPYGQAAVAAAAAAAAAQQEQQQQQQQQYGAAALPHAQLNAGVVPAGGVIHQHATDESMRGFWQEQMTEVQNVGTNTEDFKNHQLPLARIKKIMKSDEDVRMISAEAPVLFARACETFVLELTLRAWRHAEENKRRTLQRNDVAAAITRTDVFDFLVDIVPREGGGGTAATGAAAGGVAAPATAAGGGGDGGAGAAAAVAAAMAAAAAGQHYWPAPGTAAPPPPGAAGAPAVDPAVLQYYQQTAAAAAAAAQGNAGGGGGGGGGAGP